MSFSGLFSIKETGFQLTSACSKWRNSIDSAQVMAEATLIRPPEGKPKMVSRPIISSRLPKAFSQPSKLKQKPSFSNLAIANEFKQTKVLLSPLKLSTVQQGKIAKALKQVKPDIAHSLDTVSTLQKNVPTFLKAGTARLEDVITFSHIASSHRSGLVKKGLHALTLKILAVKQVPLSTRDNRQILIEWLSRWQDLQSKNSQLLQVAAAFWNNPEGCVSVLSEYMNGGSFLTLLDSSGGLPEALLADVSRQLVPILVYLHSKDCTHGQVTPSQVLLARNGTVKLSLGLSARISSHDSSKNLKKLTFADDIFGLGTSILAGVCGDSSILNRTEDIECCLFHTLAQEKAIPELSRLSPDFQDFICKCLRVDPIARSSAESLLSHRWLFQSEYPGVKVSLGELLNVTNQWKIPAEYRTPGQTQLIRICEALDVVLMGNDTVEPAWEWAEDLASDLGLGVDVVEKRVQESISR